MLSREEDSTLLIQLITTKITKAAYKVLSSRYYILDFYNIFNFSAKSVNLKKLSKRVK